LVEILLPEGEVSAKLTEGEVGRRFELLPLRPQVTFSFKGRIW
jgi:hypothetical protein